MGTVSDANLPTAAGYTNKNDDTSLLNVVGIALTGASILGPVSTNSVDPIYPAVDGVITSSDMEEFDACLGHPNG